MDANGVRFHLVLGEGDWSMSRRPNGAPVFSGASPFFWNSSDHSLTLAPRVAAFPTSRGNRPVSLDDRRGAAADQFGNWYSISPDHSSIQVFSSGSQNASRFWPVEAADDSERGGFIPCSPESPVGPRFAGLTVTTAHYLVVGLATQPELLIFDLHHGGPPRQISWPSRDFTPFDMSATSDGGLWILDRSRRLLWRMDRAFAIQTPNQTPATPDPDPFQPMEGAPSRTLRPPGAPPGIPVPAQIADPIAIESLPDGSLLILDRNPGSDFSAVYRWSNGSAGAPFSLSVFRDLIPVEDQATFTLRAQDFAFTSEENTADGVRFDILHVVAESGDQSFAFHLTLSSGVVTLKPLASFHPLRLYNGKAIVAAGSKVYYGFSDRWLPVTVRRRQLYVAAGVLETPVFDGKEPGCVWHRFFADGCFPSESNVEVWSRTHDEKDVLATADWSREPALLACPSGSELPWEWRQKLAGIATHELLFQKATGRYLQLKIQLSGNEASTPRLRALRLYYQRFSYLNRYLPAAYRQDTESASFLDRFLANMEGQYTALEDRIANLQTLIDSRIAPPETLDWLANWFGVALDPAWEPFRRRLFLRNAMRFFQARGTINGLWMALRLAVDTCITDDVFLTPSNTSIRIAEHFRTRQSYLFDDGAANSDGLPLNVRTQLRWVPSQGAEALSELYQNAYGLGPGSVYPVTASSVNAPVTVDQWTVFSRDSLGFVPDRTAASTSQWRAFLENRYGNPKALNSAHRTTYAAFDQALIPDQLSSNPSVLRDWYDFFRLARPIASTAHRFTVYLPVGVGDSFNTQAQLQKLALVRRVVELEKPAHSVFDVRYFWNAFRLGEARLGRDTIAGLGSRAPELMRPMTLGLASIGSAFLAADSCGRELRGRMIEAACPAPRSSCSCEGD